MLSGLLFVNKAHGDLVFQYRNIAMFNTLQSGVNNYEKISSMHLSYWLWTQFAKLNYANCCRNVHLASRVTNIRNSIEIIYHKFHVS